MEKSKVRQLIAALETVRVNYVGPELYWVDKQLESIQHKLTNDMEVENDQGKTS